MVYFKKMLAAFMIFVFLLQGTNSFGETSSPDTVNNTKKSITVLCGEKLFGVDPFNFISDGCSYMLNAFEGLTRLDKNGNVVPGMAKSWRIEDGGKKFVFTLRNAKWSDGKPVTAYDFEYAWKKLLDPDFRHYFSFLLYPVKNGEAYANNLAPADSVGITAKNATTLEVVFDEPTPFFIELTYLPQLIPLREDIAERYPLTWFMFPETFVTNGAYKMSKYASDIVFQKSPTYWDKNSAALDEIRWKFSYDTGKAIKDFNSGKVDIVTGFISYDDLRTMLNTGKVSEYNRLGIYYLSFNTAKKPLDNIKVRKAISLALDRKKLIDTVIPGFTPAAGAIPYGVHGQKQGTDFREEAGAADFISPSADIAAAKKLLKEAGYPDGKGLPPIELLYNPNAGHEEIMSFIQKQLKQNLGLNIKLVASDGFAEFIDMRNAGKFSIARNGWLADYNDPSTFLELWSSRNVKNETGWKNAAYDNYINAARTSTDPESRMNAYHGAEKILMDEMPICPIYFYTSFYLKNPELSGVFFSSGYYLHLQYADLK